jgi:hypothetical protein
MAAARRGQGGGGSDEGVEIHLPEGVSWLVHRVATSRRYTDPLAVILTQWSLPDVVEANLVLDALEDAEARARESAEEQ